MDVRICNLKRYFGKTKAVDDISFTFSAGHIFGFVGPNGAGKTTTMRILATLDDPTEGNAYVNGVSLVDDPEKARKFIGFMPDTLPAHRDMTVHDYLDFFARAYGLRGAKRLSVVESVEEFTNLGGIREKLLAGDLTASKANRPLSHSHPWLTGSASMPSSRVTRFDDDCTATRHPTAQVVQVDSTWSRSHGRAANR